MNDTQPPYPPSPYGGPQPGPPARSGMSNKAQTWTGIALALPLLLVLGLIGGGVSAVLGGISSNPMTDGLGAGMSLVGSLAVLGVPIGLLFSPRTRFIGIGILIGYAVLLIVAAGACIAILAVLVGSH